VESQLSIEIPYSSVNCKASIYDSSTESIRIRYILATFDRSSCAAYSGCADLCCRRRTLLAVLCSSRLWRTNLLRCYTACNGDTSGCFKGRDYYHGILEPPMKILIMSLPVRSTDALKYLFFPRTIGIPSLWLFASRSRFSLSMEVCWARHPPIIADHHDTPAVTGGLHPLLDTSPKNRRGHFSPLFLHDCVNK